MSYVFYYDAPGSERMYEQVKERIGAEQPPGLIMQLVTRTEGGLRHLSAWNSREDWDRFRAGRVGPAVAAVLEAAGIPAPPGEPEEHELDVIDLELNPAALARP